MSLALTSAQSLRAVNTWIGIIDSNIEGTNRVAYKNVRPVLTDGLGRSKILNGLKGVIPSTTLSIQATTTEFTQGQVINTDDPNHRAINGEGYFIFADQQGKALYSRDGEVKSIPGEYFNYLSNSRGLYMLDRAMAMNFEAHEEHLITAAEVDQGAASGRGWLNAQEKILPPLTPADFEFDQPKPIWFQQEVGTNFDEWSSTLSYRNQTVMLRKSFVANTQNYKENNSLTIEIPGQIVPGPAIPRFYNAATGNRFVTDPLTGELTDPLEAATHPMATQVYLNGQLVKAFVPNDTGVTQSITLNNADLAPYMQEGMNTISLRVTEFTGEEGILIEGNMGGEHLISDKTWAAQIVGIADAGGFVGANGQAANGALQLPFAYDPKHDRVGVFDPGGPGFIGGVLDSAANFAYNYQTPPPIGSDNDEEESAGAPIGAGEDPDGIFRLNLSGSRRVVDFEVYSDIPALGDPEDVGQTTMVGGILASNDTTLGNFNATLNGENAPVTVWQVEDDGAGDVNFLNLLNNSTAATGTGIDFQLNGSSSLQFYIPDMDPNTTVSYLKPGGVDPIKVRVRVQETINVGGVPTPFEYYEIFEFRRDGNSPNPLPLTDTPNPISQNFQGPASLQALTIPDYDDMVLAIAPNQQGLRYSQYGSTIFEVQDKVGVQTTGILQTGRPGQDGFGMVMKSYLEQANAGMTEHIPMLSMAQKIFSAISKIIAVSNSVTDDMNGLIR